MSGATTRVTIEALGSGGDGIAEVDGERWFVAGALPGESPRVCVTQRNRAGVHARIVTPDPRAPERTEPPCRHFADAAQPCGGCQLQHLATAAYSAFKRDLVRNALAHRGLATAADAVALPRVSPAGSRRRVALTAVGSRRGVVLGYHQRASRCVVDITECSIARPAIVAVLPALRSVLAPWLRAGERARIGVTAASSGLAIDCTGPLRHPPWRQRERLEEFAATAGVARIDWRPTAKRAYTRLVGRNAVMQSLDGIEVELPPGGFVQPTAEGEAAIRETLVEALASDRPLRIGDFYAGCGSLGLPLARRGHAVHCAEGERSLVTALGRAARAHDLPLTVERRDLAAAPPTAAALAAFDAAVFDPPRGGAAALARALAASAIPTVVAVSCHPGTFARDARILVDGGYDLTAVQPIDQFLYSTHVEAVAVFQR